MSQLPPYPSATWRDHVEGSLRGMFVVALVLAVACHRSWWPVAGLGAVTVAWTVYLGTRDAG